jgi:hypothetical protein
MTAQPGVRSYSYVHDAPALFCAPADWLADDARLDRIAVAVIAQSARDALAGDQDAREWLASEDAQIWLRGAGISPDAARRGVAMLLDHPEWILIQVQDRRRRSYTR